jgi:hypothetical protein
MKLFFVYFTVVPAWTNNYKMKPDISQKILFKYFSIEPTGVCERVCGWVRACVLTLSARIGCEIFSELGC